MEITIDANAGFCFGVTRAIQTANDKLNSNIELYCLGELVHNEEEMTALKEKGLKEINYSQLKDIVNSNILFRAHGEPEISYDVAAHNNNKIIDTTCPIVKQLQKKVLKSYNQSNKIYIFGEKTHPEIIGIIGNINNDAVVFDSIEQIKSIEEPNGITLYCQTTMIPDDYEKVIRHIKSQNIKVTVKNTICTSVRKRIEALKHFCKQHDVIIFVSGENSSNGKSLFSICKNLNNSSYHISNENEIKKEWFYSVHSVGISGATSTPRQLLEKIAIAINLNFSNR